MRAVIPRCAAPALAALLATLPHPAAAQAQAPSFQTYVSIGDSLAAGYSSGSLVETHQRFSVPALIARQAGVSATFQQPLIAQPGIPPELTLLSLAPIIVPRAERPGLPLNAGLTRPYNNLAVPGALIRDAQTDSGTDSAGFSQIILRGRGSQIEQATTLRPTFVTLWIGNNDVLGAAVRGRAIEGVTLTPKAAFRASFQALVSAARATGARVVAANLPDVTTIPFVTTIPPVVVNPATGLPVVVGGQRVPLLGPNGPLAPGTLVTLAASDLLARGVGVPRELGGAGTPLPDEVILDAGEVAIIGDFVASNNAAIRDIAAAAQVPVLDVNALLREIHTSGRRVAGVTLTTAFLTGGLFSYDGVHLTDLGYALMANEWIALVNANGGSLPPLDLAPFLGLAPRGTAGAATLDAGTSASLSRPLPEFSREAWEQLLAVFPTVDR